MPFQEDTDIFMDDFALPVTARGISVSKGGILSQPQEFLSETGEVVVTDYNLTVVASDFGMLRLGDVVDVNGVRYRVRQDARLLSDGMFAQVPLMKLRTNGND